MAVIWNEADKNGDIILTNNGITASLATGFNKGVRANTSKNAGKWYWEIHPDSLAGGGLAAGIATSGYSLSQTLGESSTGWALLSGGQGYHNGSTSSYLSSITASDIIGIAIDIGAQKIWFAKNNTWGNSGDPAAGTNPAFSNLPAGTHVFPALSISVNDIITGRFPVDQQSYAPPAGFSAISNTERHILETLVNRNGAARANLTGLNWAFFDQPTPDLLQAPVDQGTTSTDAAGFMDVTVLGTTLLDGQVGFFVISDSDGTVSDSFAFAAPVAVTEIVI